MEVKGKVKVILEQQTFGGGFTKREVVITTEEQYPQDLIIEFVQDKVHLLSDLTIGDIITISINLRGREWQAPDGTIKYFNSIQGWKINKATDNYATPNSAVEPPPMQEEDFDRIPDNDDLPF